MSFQDLQQEVYSCDQLEKLLKFQMRISASFQGGLTVAQIVFIFANAQVYATSDRYAFLLTQVAILALACYGIFFSFSQLEKVASTSATYYHYKDSKVIVALFIVNLLVGCVLVALTFYANISQMLYSNLQLAQFGTVLQADTQFALFTFLCLLQTLCFGFMANAYWMFCDTVYIIVPIQSVAQSLCCDLFSTVSMMLISLICYGSHSAAQMIKIGVLPTPSIAEHCSTITGITLFILFWLAFVIGHNMLGVYIPTFKTQVWKLSSGVVLLGALFVLVAVNGLLSREVIEASKQYTVHCQRYLDLAPEASLQQAGCSAKYLAAFPGCQQLFAWERWPAQEFKCINPSCCALLSNYFLASVSDVVFECYLLTSLLVVLVAMLFHVRRSDDSAALQSFKIKLAGLLVGLIVMLMVLWVVPINLPAHKPVLTDEANYLPGSDVLVTPQGTPPLSRLNLQPYGCNPMTISEELAATLKTSNPLRIVLTLEQGYFLLVEVNVPNLWIDSNCAPPGLSVSDCLAVSGAGKVIMEMLVANLKLCLTSIVPQLQWTGNTTRRVLTQVTTQRSSAENQQLLSSYLHFLDVVVDIQLPDHQLDLYDSLVLDCSPQVRTTPTYMSVRANETGQARFYNYPSGAYGTVVLHHHNSLCQSFQAYSDVALTLRVPTVRKMTFLAEWGSTVDMDLLVYFAYGNDKWCLVGSKASHECGLTVAGSDVGGLQSQVGETLTSTEVGRYNYLVFVRSPSFKGSLVVYAYLEGASFPVQTIRVDQSQAQSDTWVAACLQLGEKLVVVNKFSDTMIPDPKIFC